MTIHRTTGPDREQQRRLDDAIEDLQDDLLATLQQAVRTPSVSGQEHAMQDLMEALYRDAGLGLDVIRLAPDIDALRTHPAFIDTGLDYTGRHNVIGTLQGDDKAPSLILNGHMDVVPPGNVAAWQHDPWGGDIQDGWLYGRGAGDMKAGLIANLFALKAIRRAGMAPTGRVMLQAVIEEEVGGTGGTLACLAAGQRAQAMICTEPHDLSVTVAHAGVAYFRVNVTGKPAHAGQAHRGVNAIALMMPIVEALTALDAQRGAQVHFDLIEGDSGRSCHLNVGTLHAGDWPSSVPAEAQLECRIGFVPGETLADIRAAVTATIASAAQANAWLREHPPRITWYGWQAEPWFQDPSHPFVQTVSQAIADTTGQTPRIAGRSAGIDSRFSACYGIAAICTGPTVQNMHGIDERVNLHSVVQTTRAVARAVLSWCGVTAAAKAAD